MPPAPPSSVFGSVVLDVPRFEQPDDVTCGPTCLTQVYRYYGLDVDTDQIIGEVQRNRDGGTMAVYLAISALERGFRANLYSYNLRVFDPTWSRLGKSALADKLIARAEAVSSPTSKRMMMAYLRFLELGGGVRFRELDTRLLHGILSKGRPILTGLSATYLYRTPREYQDEYDDVRGNPVGHFVVVCGYYSKTEQFVVRDPSSHIPFSRSGRYAVGADRLYAAILLGDVTYDAVLLELWPK